MADVRIDKDPKITDHPFFVLAEQVLETANALLREFNSRDIKLKSLSPHQRIFLFFITRAIKTFSAIKILCQEGCGQDMATLLRGLLENLISVKYILCEPRFADQRAIRFVEYKWVIFKRYLPDEREDFPQIPDTLCQELIAHKALILDKIKEFKGKYKITSDLALITWSGHSVRDMARMIDKRWAREYDSTFRLSSRFSHPSIIGDREYMNQKDNHLIFYPFASMIGVFNNLRLAMDYLYEYLLLGETLFHLGLGGRLQEFRKEMDNVILKVERNTTTADSHHSTAGLSRAKAEDIVIKFQGPPVPTDEM